MEDANVGDEVLVPRAHLDALVHELHEVRARLDALERGGHTGPAPGLEATAGRAPAAAVASAAPDAPPGRVPSRRSGPSGTSIPTDDADGPGIGRRAAIAGLLGATAGGVAALAQGSPAAAATGDHWVLGQNNTALATTYLDAKGSADTALYVKNNGGLGVGIRAEVTSNAAVYGYSTATSNTGISTAGFENANDGQALNISSDGPQMRFQTSTPNNPITTPKFSVEGQVRGTQNGELWHCVNYGTPGTWRKLSGRTTAGALHVLPAPARVYDSRAGTAPSQGPKTKLSGNAARTIDLKVNSSGVPAGATAALLTVLLVDAYNGNGNMTVWAAGVARPVANTMVWGGSAARFTTSTVSALDSQARIQVAASAATNIVIDVVGYYR